MTQCSRFRSFPPHIINVEVFSTDVDGATTLRGLFAIGEVACTGLHGANRLASNSLLEAVVLAKRCAAALLRAEILQISSAVDLPEWRPGHAQDVDELVVIYHNWDEIRRLMWDYVGIVRTSKRSSAGEHAAAESCSGKSRNFIGTSDLSTDLLELRNLCTVASLIVDCALLGKKAAGYTLLWTIPKSTKRNYCRDSVLYRY